MLDLIPHIRASLEAKLERLLSRPIIAELPGVAAPQDDDAPALFRALRTIANETTSVVWAEHPDGTFFVRVAIDYDDRWRGAEKEILEAVRGAAEASVTLLTDQQRTLLQRSPREFLALNPRPETAQLVSFEVERIGGSERVTGLQLSGVPESRGQLRHVAIVPNLVQLQRQLDALHVVANAGDGPLAPLRALVGCRELPGPDAPIVETTEDPLDGERLDEHQRECVRKALATPHFAVIEGPPGSGKTTVISAIIRRAVARGERVLVVSPTHVAVDNLVEKLIPKPSTKEDPLEPHTLPIRYAVRPTKLSTSARRYWVGPQRQARAASISERLRARLTQTLPVAEGLFAREGGSSEGVEAPLSAALARVDAVICGTPIGILSCADVKNEPAGGFDLLIVDEVSKMTLPEFLAIAVKARRWVVVGDPAQLPPFNDAEDNAATLAGVIPPLTELACSVAAIIEGTRPSTRSSEVLVVVASEPERAAATIAAQLERVADSPHVSVVEERRAGIVVCAPEELDRACATLSAARARDGEVIRVLVEHGVCVPRPTLGSGRRLVGPEERFGAYLFDKAFALYHAQPWAARARVLPRVVDGRAALERCLPAKATTMATGESGMMTALGARYAINTISVFDWLTGISAVFDLPPLADLASLPGASLRDGVAPYVGRLRAQYRMHPSLSRVPRELFYFGEALHDTKGANGSRVVLMQVSGDDSTRESNEHEIRAIQQHLETVRSAKEASIMLITPYREQERRLREATAHLVNLNIDVCTLDRCQGREADYVFVSLVRSTASPFLDMPKRWNVALTRAKEGLFIVGDLAAYRAEVVRARRRATTRAERETRMSVLARIIEAYDQRQRAAYGGSDG